MSILIDDDRFISEILSHSIEAIRTFVKTAEELMKKIEEDKEEILEKMDRKGSREAYESFYKAIKSME
ncbi:MAG: hypothetical protein DRJ47_01555 [Thermoprotei archaeon]|nr:MAG: hypothetical protein DRJ47_01555 [Thermoprotei archaeon]